MATVSAASVCPWAHLATAPSQTKSPKLQEILDEELAVQLCEAELLELEQSSSYALDDVYGHLQEKARVCSSDDDADSEHDDDAFDSDLDLEHPYEFSPSKCHRARNGRRRHPLLNKIRIDGQFDDRTYVMLNRLAGRAKLCAVQRRLHASARSLLHHALAVPRTGEVDEEPAEPQHLVVKILKAPSGDYHRVTSEALELSGRPMNAEMVEMSVRRQLKMQITHEFTSLSRAVSHGVRAPAPHCSMEHVLLMQFIGDEGCPAPALRDCPLTSGQLTLAFIELLGAMRKLYQGARMVHGALNEYNVLYYKDSCWLVDFAHTIDIAHEEHIDALRSDIEAVHGFFAARGVAAATKHRVGLLNTAEMEALVTAQAPLKVLSAYPCLKPYFYNK
ncbi:hypothetical protein ATCC90586_007199 [Pythium insidiosum]|nr:hypothetical protein ATCC90586_007199 [Pythium insidiosum]